MKPKYLRRELHRLDGSLVLFTSKRAMELEMQRLRIDPRKWAPFPANPGNANTTAYNKNGTTVYVVCVNVEPKDPLGMVGLMVHEAVHVFQLHCEAISEHKPSDEFMAYGIQYIAHDLIEDLGRQFFRRKKP